MVASFAAVSGIGGRLPSRVCLARTFCDAFLFVRLLPRVLGLSGGLGFSVWDMREGGALMAARGKREGKAFRLCAGDAEAAFGVGFFFTRVLVYCRKALKG